jgi:hypothetical protein
MKKLIIAIVFGQRTKGQTIPEPSFKTTYPEHRPDIKQWIKDYNFGSKYGHRGSFYHKPEHVVMFNIN